MSATLLQLRSLTAGLITTLALLHAPARAAEQQLGGAHRIRNGVLIGLVTIAVAATVLAWLAS